MLGPQGCGKGTQAKMLAKKLNLGNISMGDLFRKNMKEQTDIGKKIVSFMNSGALVPADLTNQLIKEELEKEGYKNGVILDGYPRSLAQTEFLENFMKVDYVIFLDIPKKETIKRLSARRQCSECKKIFGYLDIENIKDNKCPICGVDLYQRDDDKPEAIKKRLEMYESETKPLIAFYKKKGLLKKIDGAQSIEKVQEDILAAVK